LQRRTSSEKLLPLFAKVGALGDMAQVAKKLVMAKKAVAQIRAIENKLESQASDTLQQDFKLAMQETAKYARIAAESAGSAIDILRKLKPKVEAYQRKLKDAIS
jgi:hypothetical protein